MFLLGKCEDYYYFFFCLMEKIFIHLKALYTHLCSNMVVCRTKMLKRNFQLKKRFFIFHRSVVSLKELCGTMFKKVLHTPSQIGYKILNILLLDGKVLHTLISLLKHGKFFLYGHKIGGSSVFSDKEPSVAPRCVLIYNMCRLYIILHSCWLKHSFYTAPCCIGR